MNAAETWSALHEATAAYKALRLHDVMDYEKFCMISIVWHSTKIEGCALTETDTRVLLDHGITAGGKPLADHLMVKDHFAAFQYIVQEARVRKPLSTAFIQVVGGMVMQHTVEEAFCEATNARLGQVGTPEEVLKLAADVHYNFVNIHPFGDGNGRTARLLMNYVQWYHGEPPIKIFTEDRAAYIQALNDTEAQADLDIFRAFVCRQQIKFLRAEMETHRRDFSGKGFTLLF